jgi:uncharacterized protein YkwD
MTQARKPRRALRALVPLAAVSALALTVPAPASAAACKNSDANPATSSLKKVERATLCLLNQKRRQTGLRKLRHNKRLSRASKRHSRSMVARKVFEHGNFVGRIKAARYLKGSRSWSVGENIAWGSGTLATPEEIVRAWMNSPPHRHNILSSKFREIGIGTVRGVPVRRNYDGATYTTDFGRRG